MLAKFKLLDGYTWAIRELLIVRQRIYNGVNDEYIYQT